MHTSRTCCGVKANTKNFSWWYLCAVPAPENTKKRDYYQIQLRHKLTAKFVGYN